MNKANAPNQQFSSFTHESSDIPILPLNKFPVVHNVDFSSKCILEKLDSSKSVNPDSIPTGILSHLMKECFLVTGFKVMLYLYIKRVTELYQLTTGPSQLRLCVVRLIYHSIMPHLYRTEQHT